MSKTLHQRMPEPRSRSAATSKPVTISPIKRMKQVMALALSLACLATQSASAAVAINSSQPFNTRPLAADWSTRSIPGSGGTAGTSLTTAAAADAAVQTNAASSITAQLIEVAALAPTGNGLAQWSSGGRYILTRATGNSHTLLMVSLTNTTASVVGSPTVSYDFAMPNALAGEDAELAGHRVYYSFSGAADSWTHLPELTSATPTPVAGQIQVTLNNFNWPANSALYILWLDDNGGPGGDGSFSIDNFIIGNITPPVITQQPANTTNLVSRTVSLSATATGIGIQYQWHKVGVGPIDPIGVNATANTATLVITNAQLSDTGDYFVTVNNQVGGVSSANARIQINPDTFAPRFLSARIIPSAGNNTFLLVTDEPLCTNSDPTTGCGSDASFQFNWEIQDAATQVDLGVATITLDGTNVTFTTSGLQEAGKTYRIVVSFSGDGVSDLFGNTLPLGTFVETLPTVNFQQNVGGYAGTFDTELRGAAPDTAQGVNAGVTVDLSDGGAISHGLLRFESIFGSSAGQIPVGSEIVLATLTIQHNALNANSVDLVNLHRMLVSWDAATATYNSLTAGVQADGVEAVSAFDVVINSNGRTVPFTLTVDVTASLQAWANGAPNLGWAFLPTGTDGYRWDTSESATPPALTVAYRIVPCLVAPSITTQAPATLSVNEGTGFSINPTVAACEPTFQWTRNGADITGANGSSFSLASAVAGASGSGGSYRLRVTNPFGTVTSDATVVTVIGETNRPTVTSVTSPNNTTIVVAFSEAVTVASGQNTANYPITPSVAVSSAVLSADGRTVTLTTAARNLGTAYTLRIQGVADRSAAGNLVNPNPTVVPLTTIQVIDGWNSTWSYNTNNLDATLAATPWYSPSYILDATWQTGNALFGTETSAGVIALFPTPIATALPPNTNTPPDMITYYFRKQITLPAIPAGTTYAINHFIDDGAIFWLDGVEIGRLNMTGLPPVVYTNRASSAGEATLMSTPFTASAGTHTLAVEVHQGGTAGSSDVLFGAQIMAIATASPRLTISHPGTNVLVTWSADSSWDLQRANTVTGAYGNLAPTAFGMYTAPIPATPTNHFYRLQYRPSP